MGHTTRISDYEMAHAWTVGPEAESDEKKSVTKSKVVEPEDSPEAKKSTARTKSK